MDEKLKEILQIAMISGYTLGQNGGECIMPKQTEELLLKRLHRETNRLKKRVWGAYQDCVSGKSKVMGGYPHNWECDPVNGTRFHQLIKKM